MQAIMDGGVQSNRGQGVLPETPMNNDNDYMEFPTDPIYQEFRKNIKERDAFLTDGTKGLKLNDRIKIWRTKRDIENDTKR